MLELAPSPFFLKYYFKCTSQISAQERLFEYNIGANRGAVEWWLIFSASPYKFVTVKVVIIKDGDHN